MHGNVENQDQSWRACSGIRIPPQHLAYARVFHVGIQCTCGRGVRFSDRHFFQPRPRIYADLREIVQAINMGSTDETIDGADAEVRRPNRIQW